MSEDLTQIFLEELTELSEQLDDALLALRSDPTASDPLNAAFRSLHTIKGSGAMFGFIKLSEFVHRFETTFDLFRNGKAVITNEVIEISFRARDLISALLDPDATTLATAQATLELLEHCLGAENAPAPVPVPAADGTGFDFDLSSAAPAEEPMAADASSRRLTFGLIHGALGLGSRPDIILKDLMALGATGIVAMIDDLPPLDRMDPTECYVRWSMSLPPEVTEAQIEDVFGFHDAELTIEPADAPAMSPDPEWTGESGHPTGGGFDLARDAIGAAAPARTIPVKPADGTAAAPSTPPPFEPPTAAAPRSAEASVRVAAEKLDMLMDQVGELVIAEARLTELAHVMSDQSLIALSEQITRLSSGLRTSTMSMRMVPFRQIVSRLRRLIVGLSEQLGKDIDFEVEGEDTELDKTMIEKLVDPLVHILRNSMDHGIEDAATRLALGKPATGKIKLTAVHSGNEVLVIIRDDGKGLDTNAIRQRGIERGIITADQNLPDERINALIFEPNFSTRTEVSELSGRGVGMDVVRKSIDGLRGGIEVKTARAEGTQITLRMPLTLAIVEGMLIQVGEEKFTVPLTSVKEIVDLPASKATCAMSDDFLDLRGSFVPFLRLRRLIGMPVNNTLPQVVIVVQAGTDEIGIVVDRIIGKSQTVIKQMSPLHENVRMVAGATILGDGGIALILDIYHLIELGRRMANETRKSA